MRAVILILILVVIALIIAVASGFLHVSQTRTAAAPNVNVNGTGLSASGGQTPAFDVETGSVSIGTKERQVRVPSLQVNSPAANAQQDQNSTANAQ